MRPVKFDETLKLKIFARYGLNQFPEVFPALTCSNCGQTRAPSLENRNKPSEPLNSYYTARLRCCGHDGRFRVLRETRWRWLYGADFPDFSHGSYQKHRRLLIDVVTQHKPVEDLIHSITVEIKKIIQEIHSEDFKNLPVDQWIDKYILGFNP